MKVSFHRLIHKDLRSVIDYYRQEAGPDLVERFLSEFDHLVAQIAGNPQRFSPITKPLRRANLPKFPYHLLSALE